MSEFLTDLGALADFLTTRNEPLAKAIGGLIDTHSVKTDLVFADDQMRALVAIVDEAIEAEAGAPVQTCAMALLSSAIILYARSMKTQSRYRRTIDRTSKFSADEQSMHAYICDLRDKMLAHFGPGPETKGYPWQQDGAFVFFDPQVGSVHVATISKRKVADRDIVSKIQLHIHRSLMLVERDVQERNTDITHRIADAIASGELTWDELRAMQFDVVDFFGDVDAANRFLQGPRTGHGKGIVHHRLGAAP